MLNRYNWHNLIHISIGHNFTYCQKKFNRWDIVLTAQGSQVHCNVFTILSTFVNLAMIHLFHMITHGVSRLEKTKKAIRFTRTGVSRLEKTKKAIHFTRTNTRLCSKYVHGTVNGTFDRQSRMNKLSLLVSVLGGWVYCLQIFRLQETGEKEMPERR